MMMRWQDVRFGRDTRLELVGGNVIARPLYDRFVLRGSGDEGPAGIYTLCAFDYTYGATDVRDELANTGIDISGEQIAREVWLSEVGAIVRPAPPGTPLAEPEQTFGERMREVDDADDADDAAEELEILE